MSETQSLLRVRKTDYICDRCSEGTMVCTNASNQTFPPHHLHRCDLCGWTAAFLKTYPHIEYIQEVSQ